MNKFQQIKEAIKNPPPERIAKTEYQSHFLNILGVLIVCAILIYKGYWYIIFALIFSIGISYSQGISAYQRYLTIMSFKSEEDIEKDISPSRKRSRIIESVFGKKMWWISIFISLCLTYFIVGVSTWYHKMAFVLVVLFLQFLTYFFIIYWIAYPFYRRDSSINKNEPNKNTHSKRYRRD